MVFGRFSRNDQKEHQVISALPSFTSLSKDESTCLLSLELESTTSTDTDSSLSVGVEDNQRHPQTPDLESHFGKLRHRTFHTHDEEGHAHSEYDGPMDDSDSEHGLVPRRRRKTNHSTFNKFLGYALVVAVALLLLRTMKPSLFLPFSNHKHNKEWNHFEKHTLPMVRKAFKKYQPEQQYTIILRGGRLDLLQQSLDNYSRCPSVKQIQIDFDNGGTAAAEIPITLLSQESKTAVVPFSESTPTSAVFLLSEDILLSCSDMEKGFQAWRKDPRRLVGFLGFQGSSEDGRSFSTLHHVAPGTGSYAFVSNRAVFVHKVYLDSLSSSVNTGDCCEVSLSAQVSAAFETAPVVVKANVVDLVEGLTTAGDRHQVGLCDDRCLPAWLQIDDWNTIPQEHTAILG